MKTLTGLFTLSVALIGFTVLADDDTETTEFASPTIDLGCVVSDIDASVKFYTEAIGFKSNGGFQVDAEFATDVGLTNRKGLDIKVLTLGDGKGATKLKLMQIGNGNKKASNDYIDTTLGFSYLTVFVKSTDAAMARLRNAGVKPIAKGPATLPTNLDPSIALTIIRDPDGNLIELLGPK